MQFVRVDLFLSFLAALRLSRWFPRSSQNGSLLCWAATIAAWLLLFSPSSAVAQSAPSSAKTYSLTDGSQAGEATQVRLEIETAGVLKLNAKGTDVAKVAMKVRGEQLYVEKLLSSSRNVEGDDKGALRSLRSYERAAATIELGKDSFTSNLRPERAIVAVSFDSGKDASGGMLFSTQGPLTRDELELIDLPASTLLFAELLPKAPLTVGGTWKLDEAFFEHFFRLEAISSCEAVGKLMSHDGKLALAEISGKLSGAIGGVATDIDFQAKYYYSATDRRISSLSIAYQEKRSIGHAEPGFDALTKVRVTVAPFTGESPFSDPKLAAIAFPASEKSYADDGLLLEMPAAKAAYYLLHDRRFRVMTDRQEVTILRMVADGDLIAQCNVSPLPDLPAGKKLPLEEFQLDIRKTLGDKFGQFATATESTTDTGLRVLRVVALGTVSELPIQWIYYHLSDESGRRAALVFTLEATLEERFGQADATFIGSFAFRPRPEPTADGKDSQETAAGPAEKTATKAAPANSVRRAK